MTLEEWLVRNEGTLLNSELAQEWLDKVRRDEANSKRFQFLEEVYRTTPQACFKEEFCCLFRELSYNVDFLMNKKL